MRRDFLYGVFGCALIKTQEVQMKKLIFIGILVVFTLTAVQGVWGQEIKFPKASPAATVMQTIGLTDVTVVYHRPGVKGREIWGKLVPYNEVWRTGANNATTIEFSTDAAIEGQPLKAGKYALFTIPGQDEWTIILNKQTDIWGDNGYKEDQDVLRVKVKPMEAVPPCEWMIFVFTDLSDNGAKLMLRWEKVMVSIAITVDTKAIIAKNIDKTMGRYFVQPYYAANYAFNEDDLQKAKKYVDMSTGIEANYWNTLLQAKIYKKLAKDKKAEKAALDLLQKAISLIKSLPEGQQKYADEAPKLLEEWGGKKK